MKRIRYKNGPIDSVDAVLLTQLARDARITMAELARKVKLSAPSVAERIRRLEEAGVIEGHGIRVNPEALGLPLSAYIRVRPIPGQLQKVVEILKAIDFIVECDRVTGEDCFIAKAHVPSVASLEKLLDKINLYALTNTSIIQSSPVRRRLPPLPSM